ncbi:MAG: RnfABCDGE type electron transport complex subunit G [Cellulosilyticum sp.]|nr:RnfABCDGE type electron transport complex subunit G [Cellulosilyticum sp.]
MNHPLKLGGILFLITAICVGILGAVNQITAPIIAANEIKSEEAAMRKLITEAEHFIPLEDLADESVKKVCIAQKGDTTIGYVLRMEPNGYGGAIKLLIGIDLEGNVAGISILEHSETPGFGANAEKESFKGQFTMRKTPLLVSKAAPDENEIQAITGATITSEAITNAVNSASEYVMAHQEEWRNVQ